MNLHTSSIGANRLKISKIRSQWSMLRRISLGLENERYISCYNIPSILITSALLKGISSVMIWLWS